MTKPARNAITLQEMDIGERLYFAVDAGEYPHEQKLWHVTASRSKVSINVVMATAVMSSPAGAVRHLLCVERLK